MILKNASAATEPDHSPAQREPASALRCAGVAMVRNEADVIELWARYNLRVLDHLHVIDHGSQDNTREILEQLQAEGLPVTLHHWGDGAHTQAEAMRALARPLAVQGNFDFFVPLDGDELLATDRDTLHRALRALPDGHAGSMRWRTYLPEGPSGDDGVAFFRRMKRYRSEERPELHKVIAPARMLADHCWQIGNHNLYHEASATSAPCVALPFPLAHYPLRSESQLRRKVMVGAHAARLKQRRIRNESWHWLYLENLIREQDALKRAIDLETIALGYSYASNLELATPQRVEEGAVDACPEVVQRYAARPMEMAILLTQLSASEKANAAHLAEQGKAEFNEANQAWRDGDMEKALTAYAEAGLLNPTLAEAHLGRARCLVRLNQLFPARDAFATALRINPGLYSAWLEAGHLCRQMGELQQAAGAYQRAIQAAPERYEAPLAMARVLMALKEPGAAAKAFEGALENARVRAQAQGPATLPAEVAHRMGQYALEVGDTAAAVQALKLALRTLQVSSGLMAGLEDRQNEVHIDLAEALWRQGKMDEARLSMTTASGAESEATATRLATLAFRFNLWRESLDVLRKCVQRHPNSVTAHWNLAHMLAECWQMSEAAAALKKAQTLGPTPGAKSMLASIAGRQGDAETALRLYREMAAEPGGLATMASSAAMSSLYSDQLSAQEVATLHREMFAPLGQGARAADSFVRAPLEGRRIRLGIVTADFHHQHPVNIFMQPILKVLDRERFELFLYFTGVSYDDQTHLAQRRCEHWVDVTTLNDVQLAKRVDADGIDLLLDLAGHTAQQRMRLFAQRAAPVQATYLGYPGSTGVPNMDWLLGDAQVTPEADDALCSERVARLPGVVFCYAPEENYPSPPMGDELLTRPLTFGSFNNVPKLTPRTLKLWAKVLASVPGSRLLLKAPSFLDEGARRMFGQRLEALGVDLARVELRGPTGLTDMMAEYGDVDIALDPVPYNGGTTTLQAMWMGVPLVVMRGSHFVSRMGASFMTAAGLPEWVAQDDEDYVRVATRMASDRVALLALKRGMRSRLTSLPAWDPVAHTRAMEAAFESMVRQQLRS